MAHRKFAVVVAFAAVLLTTGCVERRFRVESHPPGAYLYVNNTPYGPTPVDVPFLFYGDYDIQLVKEGFQTKRVKEPVPRPGTNIRSLTSSPKTSGRRITDIRPLYYEMEPIIQPYLDLLKAEGEELRGRAADLPPPRYPDPRKDRPTDRGGVPPGEALPPPRDIPALPPPQPGEVK